MTSSRLGGALLAAVTLLSTVLAGTASATSPDHPSSKLTLTVKSPQGASTTVQLRCHPTGGSHPSPDRACRAVASADGDFDALPGTPQLLACTMEYRPVVAVARGRWAGENVRWKHKFGNRCAMRSATGVVFDF
jgi:hypothetical protein